jgi:hypothetical protein
VAVKRTRLALLCVVGGTLGATVSGCTDGFDYHTCASGRDPATREEALDCAPDTYDTWVKQVAQFHAVPPSCIYGGASGWGVAVDVTDRLPRRKALRLCGTGHVVVLGRDGHVRFAQ